jgi:hypothetical protein
LVHVASLLALTPLYRNAWSEPHALEYHICVLSGVRVAQSLVFCVVFCRCPFLVIVFFVLRFGASDYPFDISQPFSQITTDIFPSVSIPQFFLHDLIHDFVYNNTMGANSGAGTAHPFPRFCCKIRVSKSFVFCIVF